MTIAAADAVAGERDRLWPPFVRVKSVFAEYETLTRREIPVVVLRRFERSLSGYGNVTAADMYDGRQLEVHT